MEQALAALIDELPLGSDWDRPTLWHETARIAGLDVPLVGLHARSHSGSAVTAGASGPGRETLRRCYFELLERFAIVEALGCETSEVPLRGATGAERGQRRVGEVFRTQEASEQRRPSLSNAVAAHVRWEDACAAARLEAIERDRVLRSWYGLGLAPIRMCARPQPLEALCELYDVGVYRFDDDRESASQVMVVGVFLLPRTAGAPFVCAFAASPTLEGAVERSTRESLQRLGFLWREEIPETPPAPEPTPEYHLEFFLHPPHQIFVRRWLNGGNRNSPGREAPETRTDEVLYADLTPRHLRGRMFVARALGGGWLPLVFGQGHPAVSCIPEERLVHPLP